MAKNPQQSFRDVIDQITEQLAALLTSEVEHRVSEALRLVKSELSQGLGTSSGKVDGRRGGRLCPVPGCGKPGAGPRNRWFCREHAQKLSVAEQKGVLERNKRLAAEGKLPTAVPSDRIVRLPPKVKRQSRMLDMTCRVEGCTNRSRGPRAGFICDQHRLQLTPEEQKQARDLYKARQMTAKVEVLPALPRPAVPVPPIVRKAEASEG